MSDAGGEALLVSQIVNVQWLTGFTGSFGYVLVTPSASVFITDSRYAIQAEEQVAGYEVVWFANPRTFKEVLAETASRLGITKLGFESAHVTYSTYEDLKSSLGSIELVPTADLMTSLRMVKDADEIAKVEKACGIADAAFDHIRRMIQPGISEYDLNLDLEFFLRRQGAALAFDPIVVSGPNSARPHGKASERKLEKGDFLTMDFGAKLDGYCSDLTRTVVVGEASDRHREIYELVLKAEVSCIEMMKPGVLAKDVDAHARATFGDYAQYFGHGLGHGLGRDVHDTGRMGPTSSDVLAVGQIWTVEPGIYIPGFGGVRIEDDVVIEESGARVLTHAPKELLVLP
jgi:Xaa-Pro aminopeptidase